MQSEPVGAGVGEGDQDRKKKKSHKAHWGSARSAVVVGSDSTSSPGSPDLIMFWRRDETLANWDGEPQKRRVPHQMSRPGSENVS